MFKLNQQIENDNHDNALAEKMDIISTCFNANVHSVIMQIPDVAELYSFKQCVRKYARVKMRSVQYYHGTLHANEDFFFNNLRLMRPFMQIKPVHHASLEQLSQITAVEK